LWRVVSPLWQQKCVVHVKIEKASIWLGLGMRAAFMVMFWFIAGVIPPLNPNDTAEQTAQIYTDRQRACRSALR
jgi:hypothetical protein